MPRSRRLALAATATVLFLAGCSGEVSVGANAVPEAEIESGAARQLAEEVDQPAPDIDCPGDLEAEVGASLDCVLSVEGDEDRYPVTITVTAVDDENDQVDYDVEVGQEPIAN